MKRVFIVVLVVVLLIVALIMGIFLMTSGATKTANGFFQAVQENDWDAAAVFLSEDFKAATSREELMNFLQNSALLNYKGVSWSSRSVSGRTGELEGSVETEDGGRIPVNIALVKEEGGWKILSINKPDAGLVKSESRKVVPDDDTLRSMTDSCFQMFARAVNAEDFNEFYAGISELWKSQTDAVSLGENFRVFMDNDIDFTALEELDAIFSEAPFIDDKDILRLNGYYPTQPAATYFKLGYIYEHPHWKLSGINVSIK